jgi:secondary thiamine-phosphate synthase enzyme
MIREIIISSTQKQQFIDITEKVLFMVKRSGVKDGMCFLYVPHTTAAITINENADVSVQQDILKGLERIAPSSASYSHTEGNADAHIKSTLVGTTQYFLIEDGKAKLGRWQGVFFCEFDGPRQRKVLVKIC